ncbi:hypothetical protein [Candidatus Solirubrobacter pratensis]|uniref:hypothetical protein n=1 Tax=Candidatus Solirubrobacter pratensis TaxID=1298857 RepID=UPI00048274C9|nr:hypothetical protein [Candidatus Solirubrobacter pratensis]
MLAAFPDACLEDPHDLPEIAQRLGDHIERVFYDSPIRTAEDIGATPLAARVVNTPVSLRERRLTVAAHADDRGHGGPPQVPHRRA